jgi:polyisoprenoid-binding protein YceI
MSRSLIGWIVAAVFAVGGAALAWVYFAGGSGEPSTELTTPDIAGETTIAASAGGNPEFVIDPTQSLATFEIDEELSGSANHVVGTTNVVAGQIQMDPSDLSTVQFSQIIINGRTFATDSSFRDRAIRGPIILNSAVDEFELITFDVASVVGLSGSASPGDTVEFTLTGDLTVRGTTNQETFDVTVTLRDESTLTGSAETTVLRSDYGIGIPNVPRVANVGDEVLIRLEFVAISG